MISPAAILLTTSGSRAFHLVSDARTYLGVARRALIRRGASGGRPASSAVLFVPRGSGELSLISSAMITPHFTHLGASR